MRDPESFNSGSVYAIKPDDGSVVWRKDLDTTILSSTTVANGLLYVTTTRGLEIYDTATGQVVWNDKRRARIFSQPTKPVILLSISRLAAASIGRAQI